MIPEIGVLDWLSSTQLWGIIYYLYMIPEIGVLDWLSSIPNLGIIYYLYMIPEIGVLDWLSSIPNLGNNILPLYDPRNWDTRVVI